MIQKKNGLKIIKIIENKISFNVFKKKGSYLVGALYQK